MVSKSQSKVPSDVLSHHLYQVSVSIMQVGVLFMQILWGSYYIGKNQGSIGRHTLTLLSFIAVPIDVIAPNEWPITANFSKSSSVPSGIQRVVCRKSSCEISSMRADSSDTLLLNYLCLAL